MKKNIYIILALISGTIAAEFCKGLVKFDGSYYEKVYLADGTVNKPFFLTYLKKTNEILFHSDTEPFGNTSTYILSVHAKDLTRVTAASNAVASRVDSKGNIYIAQNGGLYKFNRETKQLTPIGLKDVVIYTLYLQGDKLFYTDYPVKDLYVFINETPQLLVEGLGISDLMFDKNGKMFYYNKTGVYYQDKTGTHSIEAMEYEEVPLVGLVYDEKNDKIYATSSYGVFKIDVVKKRMERISLKAMYDIVFDCDNSLIYSDEESIVKLAPTNKKC